MLHTVNRKLTVVYIIDKLITIGLFLLSAIFVFILNPTDVVIIVILFGAYWFGKAYKDALLFLLDCLTRSKSTMFVYYSKVMVGDQFFWHPKLYYYELRFYTNKHKKIDVIVPLDSSFDTLKGILPPNNTKIEICYYKYSKVLDYWKIC